MFVSILQLMTLPFGKPVQSRPGPDPLSGPREKAPQNDNRGTSRRDEARAVPEQRLPAGAHAQAGASRRQEVKSAATKPAAKTQVSAPARSSKKAPQPSGKAPAPVRAAESKGGKRKAEPVAAKSAPTKLPAKGATTRKEKAVAAPAAKAPVKPVVQPAKTVTKVKVADKAKTTPAAKPAMTPKVGTSAGTAPAKRASVAPPTKAVPPAAKSTAPDMKPSPAAAPVAAPKPVGVPASPATAPAKAGRPSRLSQITVPSMAQSVASTAAKASYTNTMSTPVLTPPTYTPAKKDPKLANNWKTKAADELTDAEVLAMPDDEYMNDKQLAFFRGKLLQLKQGILSNAGETTEHLRADTVIVPDPADRATIEEEHALELRTRDRERKLLKKIEQSIARIDAGDYGYCDETGEPIGVGRLMARPTATLSLEAQQRRELKQKMFGD